MCDIIDPHMIIKKLENLGVKAEMDTYKNIPLLHFYKVGSPFSVNFLFDFGAFSENKKSSAHFLEHMLLSGGKTFSDKKELSRIFEEKGCVFNAWTNYINVSVWQSYNSKDDFSFAFNAIEDFLINPKLSQESLDIERGAILAERQKTDKEKSRICRNSFLSILFPDTRFAIDVKGDLTDISTVTRDDILLTYNMLLSSKKILVTTGDFHIEEIREVMSPILDKLATYNINLKQDMHMPIKLDDVKVKNPLGVTGIAMFFDRPFINDKKREAIHLFINSILYNRGGLLIEKLRYENSLVYSVDNHSTQNIYVNFFGVFAETSKENTQKVLDLMNGIFFKDIFLKITKEEVAKFISSSRSKERRRYQTTSSLVDRYSYDYLNFGTDMVWDEQFYTTLEAIPIDVIIAEVKVVFSKTNQTIINFI